MKKLIYISIVCFSALSIYSCKKSYACECEGETTELNYGKVHKDDVDGLKTDCESDTTTTCTFIQK